MSVHSIYESQYKKIGFISINSNNFKELNKPGFGDFIKVLFLHSGYEVTVDFKHYKTQKPSLFFINSNQHFEIDNAGKEPGYFIYYNRDFYCVQIHDSEVACDGLLFNNVYQIPVTELPQEDVNIISAIYEQIQKEFEIMDSTQEEMLRIYLKQLIIMATRLWKHQQLGKLKLEPKYEIEFFRNFSQLVEIHFRSKHTVSDYAALLGVAAKTLSNKFKRLELPQPNEVIKDRLILEAKRLLIYTNLNVKEVAYDLGYDDPAYFNRLFANKAGDSPANFRKKYIGGK